jgi:hypothetical protein
VLRAEKLGAAGGARHALAEAAAKVATFEAVEVAGTAARRAAHAAGDAQAAAGVQKWARYSGKGLREARRLLATAALEAERYPL